MSFTIEHAGGFSFREVEGWPTAPDVERWSADDDEGWVEALAYVDGRLVLNENASRMLFGNGVRAPRLDRFTGIVVAGVSQQRCTGDQHDHAEARIAQGRNFQKLLEAFDARCVECRVTPRPWNDESPCANCGAQ
jgi:hypothetical protein